MVCVRRAWLTLGSLSAELHNEDAGVFCTELDLGSPDVREVTNDRPDAHGIDDRTLFMGGRVVSATVVAIAAAGAEIDAVAASFGPFMVPSVRPTLHYVLERPGNPERTMVLRAQSYSFKIDNDYQRDIQLAWVAADPGAYDPTTKTATATAGADVANGRTYDLEPDRTYPEGQPLAAYAEFTAGGDIPVRPLVRINGPITAATVNFTDVVPWKGLGRVAFVTAFVVGAGKYVEVDCNARAAYRDGDRAQDVTAYLNWSSMQAWGGWPLIVPRVRERLSLSGSSTSGATNAVATWTEAYLS